MAAKHCSERIVVRILHVFLTSSVVLILFLKDTELNKACIDGKWGFVIGYSGLCFLSLVVYFVASCMNPGYVSLDTETMIMVAYEKNQDEENSEASEVSENCHVVSTPLPFGTKLRRCGYCAIMQPLRSKHCEDCGRCIHRYDHHCPWLGSCVGEKNHRFFWLFLFLECCLIAWSLRITFMAFRHKNTWGQWALSNALLIVAMLVLSIGILVVFLLLSCHSYLMATGQTTWEYMSRSRISYLKIFAEGDNPFHEGICGNIYKFFCYFKPRRWEVLLRKREDCA